MGPFSRRAKGEAGGEYIKRLCFLSTCVENWGPYRLAKAYGPFI